MVYRELLSRYIGSRCTIQLEKNQITLWGPEYPLVKYLHCILEVTDDYVIVRSIQDKDYFIFPLVNTTFVFHGMEP
jgi:hypothetical protein